MASTTKRVNPGKLKAIVRRAATIGRTSVRVGWSPEIKASPETATIALYNTLGTEGGPGDGDDGIPPRPVLAPLLAAEKNTIRGLNSKAVRLANRGKDPTPALESLARTLETQGKAFIEQLSDPPNAESTVKKKGFNDPLIGEGGGRLLNEFGAAVVKRRG